MDIYLSLEFSSNKEPIIIMVVTSLSREKFLDKFESSIVDFTTNKDDERDMWFQVLRLMKKKDIISSFHIVGRLSRRTDLSGDGLTYDE